MRKLSRRGRPWGPKRAESATWVLTQVMRHHGPILYSELRKRRLRIEGSDLAAYRRADRCVERGLRYLVMREILGRAPGGGYGITREYRRRVVSASGAIRRRLWPGFSKKSAFEVVPRRERRLVEAAFDPAAALGQRWKNPPSVPVIAGEAPERHGPLSCACWCHKQGVRKRRNHGFDICGCGCHVSPRPSRDR